MTLIRPDHQSHPVTPRLSKKRLLLLLDPGLLLEKSDPAFSCIWKNPIACNDELLRHRIHEICALYTVPPMKIAEGQLVTYEEVYTHITTNMVDEVTK